MEKGFKWTTDDKQLDPFDKWVIEYIPIQEEPNLRDVKIDDTNRVTTLINPILKTFQANTSPLDILKFGCKNQLNGEVEAPRASITRSESKFSLTAMFLPLTPTIAG